MSKFSSDISRYIRDVKRMSIASDLRTRSVITANLSFLYTAVIASEQLLTDAELLTSALTPCSFRDNLLIYYKNHLTEERGHAAWLRDDLNANGMDASAISDSIAIGMVGTQYYLIKHIHPVSLLGYMAVLEGDPLPIDTVHYLEGIHGQSLLRFTRFHAIKDLEHREELWSVIDEVPQQLRIIVSYSCKVTLDHLVRAAANWH